eukprot:m.36712 g.36712  ORF g.36712 m.36712 type:complete len:144 (-) comp9175_c0_seq3:207-638(-)
MTNRWSGLSAAGVTMEGIYLAFISGGMYFPRVVIDTSSSLVILSWVVDFVRSILLGESLISISCCRDEGSSINEDGFDGVKTLGITAILPCEASFFRKFSAARAAIPAAVVAPDAGTLSHLLILLLQCLWTQHTVAGTGVPAL